MRLPERDRISMSLAKLKADIAVAMGGRIAEEMIFGKEKVTTGASSDIKQATDIARRMVTEWGMSDKLGPLHYGSDQEEVFLGHSVAQSKNVSDETAAIVDEEIKRIVQDAYNHAEKTLKDNNDELHRLAEALLEYEMLTGDEIRKVLRGEKIVRDTGDDDDIGKPRSSVPSSSDLGSDQKDDQDDVSDDGSLPQGA